MRTLQTIQRTPCAPCGCNAPQGECLGACMEAPKALVDSQLFACTVVIRMPDGSRGEHNGLYAHGCDALDKALELFPNASAVAVTVARGRRATA